MTENYWEHALFLGECDKCSSGVTHRKFQKSTGFGRGDDETLSSLCDEHYQPIKNKKARKRRNEAKRLLK